MEDEEGEVDCGDEPDDRPDCDDDEDCGEPPRDDRGYASLDLTMVNPRLADGHLVVEMSGCEMNLGVAALFLGDREEETVLVYEEEEGDVGAASDDEE